MREHFAWLFTRVFKRVILCLCSLWNESIWKSYFTHQSHLSRKLIHFSSTGGHFPSFINFCFSFCILSILVYWNKEKDDLWEKNTIVWRHQHNRMLKKSNQNKLLVSWFQTLHNFKTIYCMHIFGTIWISKAFQAFLSYSKSRNQRNSLTHTTWVISRLMLVANRLNNTSVTCSWCCRVE